MCKYINAKVDDPSAVVTLLSFLRGKITVYWGNTTSSFSKLDTNRSFKSSFCMEGYLDTISNRSHRVCYAVQRWGQLLLKVIITITITLKFLHYHYHYHYTLFGNVIITITITLAM